MLGRPLGRLVFSLIGPKRILFTNSFKGFKWPTLFRVLRGFRD